MRTEMCVTMLRGTYLFTTSITFLHMYFVFISSAYRKSSVSCEFSFNFHRIEVIESMNDFQLLAVFYTNQNILYIVYPTYRAYIVYIRNVTPIFNYYVFSCSKNISSTFPFSFLLILHSLSRISCKQQSNDS